MWIFFGWVMLKMYMKEEFIRKYVEFDHFFLILMIFRMRLFIEKKSNIEPNHSIEFIMKISVKEQSPGNI